MKIEIHRPLSRIVIPMGDRQVVFTPATQLYGALNSGFYFGDIQVWWTYPDDDPQQVLIHGELPRPPEGGTLPLYMSVFEPLLTFQWSIQPDPVIMSSATKIDQHKTGEHWQEFEEQIEPMVGHQAFYSDAKKMFRNKIMIWERSDTQPDDNPNGHLCQQVLHKAFNNSLKEQLLVDEEIGHL